MVWVKAWLRRWLWKHVFGASVPVWHGQKMTATYSDGASFESVTFRVERIVVTPSTAGVDDFIRPGVVRVIGSPCVVEVTGSVE